MKEDVSVEKLKAQIASLKEALNASQKQHKADIRKKDEQISRMQKSIDDYAALIEKLKENFDIERFLNFAPSSETRGKDLGRELDETRPSASDPADADLGGTPRQEEAKEKRRWGRQQGTHTSGRNMDFRKSLPHDERKLDLREELKGQAERDELVFVRKSEHPQIDFVDSYVRVRNTVTYIYRNRRTGKIVKATPAEHDIIKGGKLTNGFIAAYVSDRIVWGVPYYRQSRRINLMSGCEAVNAQLLTNTALCVSAMLSELGEHLFRAVTSGRSLHADETRLLVIHDKKDRKRRLGYFWMLSSTGTHPVSYCKFYPSRSADCAKELLEPCKGVALQADGYAAYASVARDMNEMYAAEIKRTEGAAEAEKFLADASLLLALGILLVGCMAHVRRRFFRAFETVYKDRPGSPGGVTCNTVMDLIAELYRIEDELRRMDGLSEKEFVELRKKRAVPVIRRLKDYAKERQPLHTAEPKLSEAISYLLNQIDTIANYLESPDLTPDNNSQERLIKTVCTTRRASMFASTEEGAASWALYHSLLQTAILNNVNPTLYLKSVLNAVAKANDAGTSAKDMDWESLMPWNFCDKIPLATK